MTARAILLCLLLPLSVFAQETNKQTPQAKAAVRLEVGDFPKECSFLIQLKATLYIVRELPRVTIGSFSQTPQMLENVELGKGNLVDTLSTLSPHNWEVSFGKDSKAIIEGSSKNADFFFPIRPNSLGANLHRNGIILFEGLLIMAHEAKGSQTYRIKKLFSFSSGDQWILNFKNEGVVTLGDDDEVIDRNISLLITLMKKDKGRQ